MCQRGISETLEREPSLRLQCQLRNRMAGTCAVTARVKGLPHGDNHGAGETEKTGVYQNQTRILKQQMRDKQLRSSVDGNMMVGEHEVRGDSQQALYALRILYHPFKFCVCVCVCVCVCARVCTYLNSMCA